MNNKELRFHYNNIVHDIEYCQKRLDETVLFKGSINKSYYQEYYKYWSEKLSSAIKSEKAFKKILEAQNENVNSFIYVNHKSIDG